MLDGDVMISNEDEKTLQKQKLDLQIKLNELLKSNDKSIDDINELKSEILHLDKQIEKIVGSNEIKRQKEVKRKKLGIEETNINNYYLFKSKYRQICKMRISFLHMLSAIENYYNDQQLKDEVVKVRV